jgi:hypothetical protein
MATLTFRTIGPARTATAAGLLTAAVGVVVLGFAGAPMPFVAVALAAAAVLVAVTRGRWSPLVGALLGLSEVFWFVLGGSVPGLLALDEPVRLAGSWLRATGIVVALIAGVLATRESADGHRPR